MDASPNLYRITDPSGHMVLTVAGNHRTAMGLAQWLATEHNHIIVIRPGTTTRSQRTMHVYPSGTVLVEA